MENPEIPGAGKGLKSRCFERGLTAPLTWREDLAMLGAHPDFRMPGEKALSAFLSRKTGK